MTCLCWDSSTNARCTSPNLNFQFHGYVESWPTPFCLGHARLNGSLWHWSGTPPKHLWKSYQDGNSMETELFLGGSPDAAQEAIELLEALNFLFERRVSIQRGYTPAPGSCQTPLPCYSKAHPKGIYCVDHICTKPDCTRPRYAALHLCEPHFLEVKANPLSNPPLRRL